MRRIARTSLLAATMAMTASAIAAPNAFAEPQSGTTQSGAPAGYSLAFSDEFNGSALDTSKWGYQYSCFDTNKHTQAQYTDSDENVSVANGYLSLTARNSPTKPNGTPRTCKNGDETYDAPFTSGMIQTKSSNGNILYAAPSSGFYMESRIKLPKSRASWSSLWMTGVKGYWPANGEIDVFESKGYDPNYLMSNTHTPRIGKPSVSEQHQKLMTGDTASSQDDFHTYGVLKTKDKIEFYFDGTLTHTVNMSDIKGDNPFLDEDNNLIIRLNHMVGGTYLANANNTADKTYVDATKFTSDYDDPANSTMYVDYVRVYTPSSETPEQPPMNNGNGNTPGTPGATPGADEPGNSNNPVTPGTPENPGTDNPSQPTPENPAEPTPGDDGTGTPAQPTPDNPATPSKPTPGGNDNPTTPTPGDNGDGANPKPPAGSDDKPEPPSTDKPGNSDKPGDTGKPDDNGTKPNEPSSPATPDKPSQPSDGDKPVTPTPAQPSDNANPVAPGQPGTPAQPSVPAPSTGGAPSIGGNQGSINTGGNSGNSNTPAPASPSTGNQGGPRTQGSWSSNKPTQLASTGASSWTRPFAVAFRSIEHFWGWLTSWRLW